jgi:hypothetical protein
MLSMGGEGVFVVAKEVEAVFQEVGEPIFGLGGGDGEGEGSRVPGGLGEVPLNIPDDFAGDGGEGRGHHRRGPEMLGEWLAVLGVVAPLAAQGFLVIIQQDAQAPALALVEVGHQQAFVVGAVVLPLLGGGQEHRVGMLSERDALGLRPGAKLAGEEGVGGLVGVDFCGLAGLEGLGEGLGDRGAGLEREVVHAARVAGGEFAHRGEGEDELVGVVAVVAGEVEVFHHHHWAGGQRRDIGKKLIAQDEVHGTHAWGLRDGGWGRRGGRGGLGSLWGWWVGAL